MNRLTCYSLEGSYLTKRDSEKVDPSYWEDPWWDQVHAGYADPTWVVYWITPPTAEQIAIGAIQVLERMNREREFRWGGSMKIQWTFTAEAEMRDLLEQIPRVEPIPVEYARAVVGGSSSEPVWPWVVGAAALFG